MSNEKRLVGDAAEDVACQWLESRGYQTLERNYNRRTGEIDLIMQAPDSDIIVFVEVRFRRDNRFGGAIESVNLRKRKKLLRTAKSWLQKHADSLTQARIDVLAIHPAKNSDPEELIWKGYRFDWIANAVTE